MTVRAIPEHQYVSINICTMGEISVSIRDTEFGDNTTTHISKENALKLSDELRRLAGE